jgi:hypothetical protein
MSGPTRAIDTAPPFADGDFPGRAERVLVVYCEGRCGDAVLREAAELAEGGAELAVVTLAPQAKPMRCCKGGGAGPYNCAVKEQADDELQTARTALGRLAARASFTKLVGTPWPPLAQWSAERSFDVAIVARERFARGGGKIARELRAATAADVRLVG